MRGMPLPWLLASMLLSFGPGAAGAQENARATIAVVTSKGRGAPNLKRAVRKLVEKPLMQHATLLSAGAFKRAGRKAKVRGKKLATLQGATSAGQQAGATHVVLIESRAERKGPGRKKKKTYFVNVQVVDVASGEVVYTQGFPLKGRRLTPPLAAELTDAVVEKLQPPETSSVPEPVGDDPPPPPDLPPPPTGEGMGDGIPPEPPPPPGEGATHVAAPMDLPPQSGEGNAETPATTLAEAPVPPPPTLSVEAAPSLSRVSDGWRPGVVVRLGGLGFIRQARIRDGSRTATKYEPPDGVALPLLWGGTLGFELYPLALKDLGGTGAMQEGIGLYGEASYAYVLTEVDGTTASQTVSSNVLDGHLGMTYRLVFWDGELAPDLRLNLGWGLFAFPLGGAAFPGIKNHGPEAGGYFNVPLGTTYLSLVLGGYYCPYLWIRKPTTRIGKMTKGSLTGRMAYRGEAALRAAVPVSPDLTLEVGLGARYSQTKIKFRGDSSLAGETQYTNATLSDQVIAGFLTVGVRL